MICISLVDASQSMELLLGKRRRSFFLLTAVNKWSTEDSLNIRLGQKWLEGKKEQTNEQKPDKISVFCSRSIPEKRKWTRKGDVLSYIVLIGSLKPFMPHFHNPVHLLTCHDLCVLQILPSWQSCHRLVEGQTHKCSSAMSFSFFYPLFTISCLLAFVTVFLFGVMHPNGEKWLWLLNE